VKLVCRSSGPAKTLDRTDAPFPVALLKKPREISLSAEQKSLLQKPLDPRVDRILQEILPGPALTTLNEFFDVL
jgi:hypothetical protein